MSVLGKSRKMEVRDILVFNKDREYTEQEKALAKSLVHCSPVEYGAYIDIEVYLKRFHKFFKDWWSDRKNPDFQKTELMLEWYENYGGRYGHTNVIDSEGKILFILPSVNIDPYMNEMAMTNYYSGPEAMNVLRDNVGNPLVSQNAYNTMIAGFFNNMEISPEQVIKNHKEWGAVLAHVEKTYFGEESTEEPTTKSKTSKETEVKEEKTNKKELEEYNDW